MEIQRKHHKIWHKKTLALLSAVILALLSGSCAKPDNGRRPLRQHGMELVELLAQMADSTQYTEIMGADNPSFEPLVQGIAEGDYTAPAAVYELTFPSMWKLLSELGEYDTLDGLPDSLKDLLDARSASLLLTQMNALTGTNALALSSLYTAEKIFVSSALEENTIYLYLFDSGYPIAVSFQCGEDHAVKATAMFLLTDGINADSIDQMKEVLMLFAPDCRIRLLEE